MLLQLNIINFALIEKLSISFEKGFNVFSGETGAGKSILIDAINYVLGGKFNKDFIRTGENRTYVEAIFSIENDNTKKFLDDNGIEYDDLVIIGRETFNSGKSVARINSKSVLISSVKLISDTLMDIHGQHENQKLLQSNTHLLYLDYYCQSQIVDTLEKYKIYYKRVSEINNKINSLQGNNSEREKLIDFLKYQIEEINSAKLKIDEDRELQEQYSVLSNAEKIDKILSLCYKNLYDGSDEILSIYDNMGMVIKNLRTVEMHMDKIKYIADSMEENYYSIKESIDEIRKIKDTIYYDEKELEYINSRIYLIDSYKRKYGESIQDILEYKNKLENQYNELVNSSEIINKLRDESNQLELKMKNEAEKLHDLRLNSAKQLEIRVKEELNYIGLEKSRFKIYVDLQEEFTDVGCDRVQFYISTNPGEPLKPMEKVVSGGELSRIMLALKTVFVNNDHIPSIIFDEVDTGISGRIAQSVAEKMFSLSNIHQVFCVTHLPQIACMGDNHYLISKEVISNKTYTKVVHLNDDLKQAEIARMIGGVEVTQLTLDHAKEMLQIAKEKKSYLL